MCTILWLTLVINKPKAIAKPGWCFMFYNTCSIRDKAEQKVFNILAHCKKQAAAAKIFGMLGCVAQQEGERIFERAPHVSLVCGSASYTKLGYRNSFRIRSLPRCGGRFKESLGMPRYYARRG